MKSLIAGVFAALLCASGAAFAQQSVGTIDKSEGYVRLVGVQGDRTVAPGVKLDEGDKLITTSSSEAVVKLMDGAVIAVRQNSEVVFTAYKFTPNDPGGSTSLIELVKGGFRKVTGLIGKTNPGAVKITTATATIGIRGTDFEAVQVGLETGQPNPGTYTRVYEGRTFLTGSDGRSVEVGANQAAYSPNAMMGGGLPFGLLNNLPGGVFSNGRFDSGISNLQRGMINNWQNQMRETLPPELQNMMPDLSNMPIRRR
jgi:FecR protein